jgi:anaerobic selenocysteine-containing dehydrogenase
VRLVGCTPGAEGRDLPGLYQDPAPDAWLIVNADPVGEAPVEVGDAVRAALGPAKSVIVLATHATATSELATVLLPGAMAVEQDGTMVADNGRLQRLRRAIDPRGDAERDATTLSELALDLGPANGDATDGWWPVDPAATARTLYRAMQREIAALQDIPWESLGDGGVPLPETVLGAPA